MPWNDNDGDYSDEDVGKPEPTGWDDPTTDILGDVVREKKEIYEMSTITTTCPNCGTRHGSRNDPPCCTENAFWAFRNEVVNILNSGGNQHKDHQRRKADIRKLLNEFPEDNHLASDIPKERVTEIGRLRRADRRGVENAVCSAEDMLIKIRKMSTGNGAVIHEIDQYFGSNG